MSREDVQTILGMPPGDYRTGPVQYVIPWDLLGEKTTWHDTYTNGAAWVGDTGWLRVEFNNEDGTVWASDFFESKRTAQYPLDTLLWRLRRQWHRWFL